MKHFGNNYFRLPSAMEAEDRVEMLSARSPQTIHRTPQALRTQQKLKPRERLGMAARHTIRQRLKDLDSLGLVAIKQPSPLFQRKRCAAPLESHTDGQV